VAGSPFAAGAGPGAIVVATGHYVYAANKVGGSVSAYSMDTSSGSLTPVAGSPFPVGASPEALVVDPSGTHLYAADSQPSAVSGFTVNVSTGALTAISGSPFPAPNGAWSVVTDGSGKLLHIANGTNVERQPTADRRKPLPAVSGLRPTGSWSNVHHCSALRPTNRALHLASRSAARMQLDL
jgi:DNA-binding beta-propeller fold protein YncE